MNETFKNINYAEFIFVQKQIPNNTLEMNH